MFCETETNVDDVVGDIEDEPFSVMFGGTETKDEDVVGDAEDELIGVVLCETERVGDDAGVVGKDELACVVLGEIEAVDNEAVEVSGEAEEVTEDELNGAALDESSGTDIVIPVLGGTDAVDVVSGDNTENEVRDDALGGT